MRRSKRRSALSFIVFGGETEVASKIAGPVSVVDDTGPNVDIMVETLDGAHDVQVAGQH